MSIETAIQAIVSPALSALTPAVPFYWGIVPEGVAEYVSLSGVTDGMNQDDFAADNKQFNIVTRTSMTRAAAIRDALKYELVRFKGVQSSVHIQSISYVRSVELPDATTGENRIASEYKFTYQGGF